MDQLLPNIIENIAETKKIQRTILFLGGGFSFVLGLTTVVGWFLGKVSIIRWIAGSPPLHFNSALCFLFFGIAFICLGQKKVAGTFLFAFLPFFISVVTFSQYIFKIDLDIDQIFLNDFLTLADAFPGRTSPNSSLAGILLSVALFAILILKPVNRFRTYLCLALGSGVFALGIIATLGYLSGVKATYSWGDLTHMPIQSAVGYAILGKCITMSAWLNVRNQTSTALRSISTPVLASSLSFAIALSCALGVEVGKNSLLPVVTLGFGVLLAIVSGVMTHFAMASRFRERLLVATNEALSREMEKRLEAEREMAIAKELAESANQSKGRFLAMVSHELRTPLSSIVGFTELLSQNSSDSIAVKKYSGIINQNGERLLHLVNDILGLSKVEANHLEIVEVEFDLQDFLTDLKALFEPRIALLNNRVSLKFQIVPPSPCKLTCDPARLRQILTNLIGNSLKFTVEGTVCVSMHFIIESYNKVSLEVRVSDTGLGIAEDKKDRLFQPFSQIENNVVQKSAGTGLGLHLSRLLAKAMDGDLTLLSSTPGEGSVFQLAIPCRTSEETMWLPYVLVKPTQDKQENKPKSSSVKRLSGSRDVASNFLV